MFCDQCGEQLDEGSKFCHICGAPVMDSAPGHPSMHTHVPPPMPNPAGRQRRTFKPLYGVAIAVVVLVLAVCGFLNPFLFPLSIGGFRFEFNDFFTPDVDVAAGEEVTITDEGIPLMQIMMEHSFAMMMEQYIVAALATERAARFDPENEPMGLFAARIEQAQSEWRTFEVLKQRTLFLADALAEQEGKTGKEKKVSLKFLYSTAYAAESSQLAGVIGSNRRDWQKEMEHYTPSTAVADMVPQIGFPQDIDKAAKDFFALYTSEDLSKMSPAERDKWEKLNKQMKEEAETASTIIKAAAISTGVFLTGAAVYTMPAAVTAAGTVMGKLGIGATGVSVAKGVVVTGTLCGTASDAMGHYEDITGKKFEGGAKIAKDTMGYIALGVSGFNLGIGLKNSYDSVKAVGTLGKNANNAKVIAETIKHFSSSQSALDKVLFVKDAKSAYEAMDALTAKGLGVVVKEENGQFKLTVVKAEKSPPPIRVDELSDEQLEQEIVAREERIEQLKKECADLNPDEQPDDWVYRGAFGKDASKKAFDEQIESLRKSWQKARESGDAATCRSIEAGFQKIMSRLQNYVTSGKYIKEKTQKEAEYINKQSKLNQLKTEIAKLTGGTSTLKEEQSTRKREEEQGHPRESVPVPQYKNDPYMPEGDPPSSSGDEWWRNTPGDKYKNGGWQQEDRTKKNAAGSQGNTKAKTRDASEFLDVDRS